MVRFPKIRPTSLMVALAALLLLALAGCSNPQSSFNPKSDTADSIHTIYIIVVTAASFVGAAVLLAMGWLLIKFRAKPGVPARQIHGNNKLELAWTMAPVLVLLTIGIPSMVWLAGSAKPDAPDALEVVATGHQWWFEFHYPGLGPNGDDLVTANELHVPVGREIAITLHSVDVIHSFWVPELVGKTDMIPNRTNELNRFTPYEPGVYYGQCAEFCGAAHAKMRFRVIVDTQADFDNWVAAHNAPPVEPAAGTAAARGKTAFAVCAGCHTIDGTTAQGKVGPNLTLLGDRLTLAAGIIDNNPQDLKDWITDVRSIKPIPDEARFMPTFKGTLSDGQISDIVAYLESQKSDYTNPTVTP